MLTFSERVTGVGGLWPKQKGLPCRAVWFCFFQGVNKVFTMLFFPSNRFTSNVCNKMILQTIFFILIFSMVCRCDNLHHSTDCNEAVCASIISKCMLTEACKCDNPRTNKTCNQECHTCLDYLYQDCCLCVGMYRLTI